MKKRTPHLRFVIEPTTLSQWSWSIYQGSRLLAFSNYHHKTNTAARNEARKVMRFAAKAEIEEVVE